MTTPAAIKTADLKRMADVAKEKGVTVWFEAPDGRKFGVSPNIPDIHKPEDIDQPLPSGSNALSEWRRLNESRFGGNPSRQKKAR